MTRYSKHLNQEYFLPIVKRGADDEGKKFYAGDPSPAVVKRTTKALQEAFPGLNITPQYRHDTYEGKYNVLYRLLDSTEYEELRANQLAVNLEDSVTNLAEKHAAGYPRVLLSGHHQNELLLCPQFAENSDFLEVLKTNRKVKAAFNAVRENITLAKVGIKQKTGGRVIGEITD